MKTPILCFGLLLLAGAPAAVTAAEADAFQLDPLLQSLGFKPADKTKLLAGEFLSNDPKESTDKELAVTVVAYLPSDMKKALSLVRERKLYSVQEDVLQVGTFGEKPSAKDLESLKYEGDELAEFATLLNAKAGSDYNLSQEEISAFQALGKANRGKNPKSDPAVAKSVLDTYRDLLVKRCIAYRQGGLKAIAPYQRDRTTQASAADELTHALKVDMVEAKRAKEFLAAFEQFPKGSQEGLESQFLWIKQRVEKRPCMILVHNLIEEKPTHAFMAQRQYFVGHNFNALQILVGAFPYEKGVIVFYRNRTSTDQVAGFGSSMRHKIGRGMMRDEILERFGQIRTLLAK